MYSHLRESSPPTSTGQCGCSQKSSQLTSSQIFIAFLCHILSVNLGNLQPSPSCNVDMAWVNEMQKCFHLTDEDVKQKHN